uniref:Uncharacterized protein n=1 Tax=Strigamia maritima TaxID=126957 RepID=T1JHV6_STRMM
MAASSYPQTQSVVPSFFFSFLFFLYFAVHSYLFLKCAFIFSLQVLRVLNKLVVTAVVRNSSVLKGNLELAINSLYFPTHSTSSLLFSVDATNCEADPIHGTALLFIASIFILVSFRFVSLGDTAFLFAVSMTRSMYSSAVTSRPFIFNSSVLSRQTRTKCGKIESKSESVST